MAAVDPDRSLKILNGVLAHLQAEAVFAPNGALPVKTWAGGSAVDLGDIEKARVQDLPMLHVSIAPDDAFGDTDSIGYHLWSINGTVVTVLKKPPAGLNRLKLVDGVFQVDRGAPDLPSDLQVYRYYSAVNQAMQGAVGIPEDLGGITTPGADNYVNGARPGRVQVLGLGGRFLTEFTKVVAVSQDFTIELAIGTADGG